MSEFPLSIPFYQSMHKLGYQNIKMLHTLHFYVTIIFIFEILRLKMRINLPIYILFFGFINIYAEGGAPMYTDGPGTPGDSNWEINTGITGTLTHIHKRYELPIIDINYGLGDTIQLKVETSNIHLETLDTRINGLGNLKAGIKWRFYDADDWMISIYPQFGYAPIKSHFNNGLAEYDTIIVLPIEITKHFGSFWTTGELGYIQINHQENRLKYGLIEGYDVNEKFTLMGEVFGDRQTNGNDETRLLNVGMTYRLSNQFGLLLSLGKELKSAESQKATVFYSGIQFLF